MRQLSLEAYGAAGQRTEKDLRATPLLLKRKNLDFTLN
jgi:hypothetical protein